MLDPARFPPSVLALAPVLGLFLLAVSASGCSHPQFATGEAEDDASIQVPEAQRTDGATPAPPAPALDAGSAMTPPDVVVPTPRPDAGAVTPSASSLPGVYALQARIFSIDTRTGLRAQASRETLYLAHVEGDGDEAELRMQRCRERVDTGGFGARINTSGLRYPDRLPVLTYRLLRSGSSFRTQSEPRLLGYTETLPADCAPGKKVTSPEKKRWLTGGLCECPAGTGAPRSPADCRVTDPDQDEEPGFTVSWSLLGGAPELDTYRMREQNELVQGVVAADRRHRAYFSMSEDDYQLDCQNTCVAAPHKFCPLEQNTVLFVPLDELDPGKEWSCTSMLELVDGRGLFPNAPATFPSGC